MVRNELIFSSIKMNPTVCSADGATRNDCQPIMNSDYQIIGYLCPDHRYSYGFCSGGGECLLLTDIDNGGSCFNHKYSSKVYDQLYDRSRTLLNNFYADKAQVQTLTNSIIALTNRVAVLETSNTQVRTQLGTQTTNTNALIDKLVLASLLSLGSTSGYKTTNSM